MKISEADFRSWPDVVIDIEGPRSADLVQTDHGDLILDKHFSAENISKDFAFLVTARTGECTFLDTTLSDAESIGIENGW